MTASETEIVHDENIMYVAVVLHRWNECELDGCPHGIFAGTPDRVFGVMSVFDNVDKLKAAYPTADIIQISKNEENNDE